MSWRISRLDYPWLVRGGFARMANNVLAYPAVIALFVARAAVAVFQVGAPRSAILHPVVVILAAVLCLVLPLRSRLGLNGADQVDLLVFGGLAVVMLSPTHTVKVAYLIFLTAQCCLSYLIAGVAKAISPGWRNGKHLVQILHIRTYCSPSTARFASRHRAITRLMAWTVICWESLFILILVLPSQFAIPFVVVGTLFHLGTAFAMGLNDFVWAWMAIYPAVLFCMSVRPW